MCFMVILFFLYGALYANDHITTQQVPGQSPLSTTIVNVFAAPTSNASSVAQNDTATTQQQTATNSTEVTQYALLETVASSFDKAMDTIPSLWAQFKQECIDHKWYIIGGSFLIGYFIIFGTLVKDNIYLNRADLWSRWKYDQTLTSLCALNQTALRKELIIAIQQRYLDGQNPTDYLKPLTRFITAIEEEKKHLETYRSRATWLKTCCLAKIMPINDAKITLVQTLIERLQFVHNLFITWASEYNWDSLA